MSSKSLLTVIGLAAIAGSIAVAQPAKEGTKAPQPAKEASKPAQPAKDAHPAKDAKPSAQPEGMPNMTPQQMADRQTCMEAGTPGKEHAEMAKAVGKWDGKCKMWMAPDSPPAAEFTCTQTIASIMDGRYIKIELQGAIPGMPGPFNGFAIAGFDNVSKTYESTWIDNCGTGMWTGKGEASSDGKVMTWSYTYNCPILKKAAKAREIHTHTGPNAYTMEMFCNEPHTGKEYKMMEIHFTRANAGTAKALD